MTIPNAITQRVALRQFRSDPIATETLLTLLEAGRLAPSSWNHQPWHLIAITGRNNIKRFGEEVAMPANGWTAKAGAIIVVCAVKHQVPDQPEREATMYFDAGLAAQNIMICATAMHLVSCPMGGWSDDVLRGWLNLPDEVIPICAIALGQTKDFAAAIASTQAARQRKPLADVVQIVE